MSTFEHNLGSGITKGAGHGGQDLIFGSEHLGDAEIGQDQGGVGLGRQVEQVLRFEV